ncbi:TlyA family RNA methyltransferase [Desulfomicrobium baculatum]|uniref:Hemolysin A n=1 Tax=Desulfomicrobium baculatum (strain DSM 4028 / VKM B-1378 / X) TaxID=525897 RepID=C7LUN5_DESBD|nr:TlyA family RNA methyltransferase [Desulfomicrobium baculatum]ACU90950.1 hemolysin A [Desulfomicrobium baculatum DSM 4028]
MAKKVDRADVVLAEQGLVESCEKATRMIMAGQVFLLRNGARTLVAKPGQQIPCDARLELKESERFVSRGGYKLLTALEHFALDVSGMVALDAGASTGGFTDCLLQFGAARVYAVDVGHAQLHWKLIRDPRVINMERINLRHATANLLPEKVDLVVADCSFISLRLILPPCLQFLKDAGQILALVKPQFELAPEHAIKGVVRSEELQLKAVAEVQAFAAEELGLQVMGSVPAGIKGPKGNQEYLLHLRR